MAKCIHALKLREEAAQRKRQKELERIYAEIDRQSKKWELMRSEQEPSEERSWWWPL